MLPDLPQRWVEDAFEGVVPHVSLGLGPGGGEVVVWVVQVHPVSA